MRISTIDQLLDLLDTLTPQRSDATSKAASDSWAEILDRPGHPLNTDLPDVNLLTWSRDGLLPDGANLRALDVGCGLGRNSRWLSSNGWHVVGIDVSGPAVAAAVARHSDTGAKFAACDFLRDQVPGAPFDFVYDSGCFHHLAPHRRISYLAALTRVLAPGGLFGICTFTAGQMGSDQPDAELLLSGRFGDGIGYSVDDLADVFGDLALLDAAPQASFVAPDDIDVFTQPFLTAALFRGLP